MSLAISPLFGPQTPSEIHGKFLSYLSLAELYQAEKVSKHWLKLANSENLWKPFFIELKIGSCVENITIKMAVLSKFQQDLPLVDEIIDLIDKDEELASIIDDRSASLEKFKKLPPLQRSLLVISALKHDCTSLLVYLPTKYVRAMANYLQEWERANEGERMIAWLNFNETEKHLPFMYDLIISPYGPYNAIKAMSATLNLLRFHQTYEKVACICAAIVKSRPNLSELFKQDFDRGNEFIGPIPVPMTTIMWTTIIPTMNSLGTGEKLGVTLEDWSACGLGPFQRF